MLRNNFRRDESSAPPFISVAADVVGVERLGVVEREDGSTGVVVPDGTPDEGAAEAMLGDIVVVLRSCVPGRSGIEKFQHGLCGSLWYNRLRWKRTSDAGPYQ